MISSKKYKSCNYPLIGGVGACPHRRVQGTRSPLALVDRAVALGIAAKPVQRYRVCTVRRRASGVQGRQPLARWASCSRPLAFIKTVERQLDGLDKRCGLFRRKVPTLYGKFTSLGCRRRASAEMSNAHHQSDRWRQRDAQRRRRPRSADEKGANNDGNDSKIYPCRSVQPVPTCTASIDAVRESRCGYGTYLR